MSPLTFVSIGALVVSFLYSLHCTHTLTAPGQPTAVMVDSTTLSTISLSWTASSGVVDSYDVMWERDISEKCPVVDEGSASITGGSTSFTITRLWGGSSYTITVTATNAAGSAVSSLVTVMLAKAGEELERWLESKHSSHVFCSSSISPSYFYHYI